MASASCGVGMFRDAPALPREQQAAPGPRPQGGRHQQRVPAGAGVGFEQLLDDDPHVGVRSVDLVNHQQVAGQARRPHVGVPHLQSAHHRLVHGAHGDLGGEETLGVFRCPEFPPVVVAGVVFPPNFVAAEVLAGEVPSPEVARHGQDWLGFVSGGKHVGYEFIDPSVQLACRRARGQRKVKPVHQPRLVHAGEPPQGCLGLAGAGLRFEDYQGLVQGRLQGSPPLDGLGWRIAGEVEQFPKVRDGAQGRALLHQVQPNILDCLGRL